MQTKNSTKFKAHISSWWMDLWTKRIILKNFERATTNGQWIFRNAFKNLTIRDIEIKSAFRFHLNPGRTVTVKKANDNRFWQEVWERTGVMAQRLTALPALLEDQSWFPSTHPGQLTYTCNCSSRRSNALFLLSQAPMHANTYIIKN